MTPVVDVYDTASRFNPIWPPGAYLLKSAKPRFWILEVHVCDQRFLSFQLKSMKPDKSNSTPVNACDKLS